MNQKNKIYLCLIIRCVLGIIITLIPTILTGNSFVNTNSMGELYTAEFIMRVITYIIGVLVIYDTVKTFNKSIF